MSLQIFKGDEASRDYENDFFREFAGNLKSLFDEENLDGFLIGHPDVPNNKYLKPDCVLITKNRLVIIDFKNHTGKLWLPDASSFEDAVWRHDYVAIEGGSSINPFAQLKKQRNWIEELIGEQVYGKAGIACVVCFQGDMKIMNSVPGKYQSWFSVTNGYQYLNRIRDIIGVKNEKPANIERIASYFEAKPFHDYKPVNFNQMEAIGEANERSAEADRREYEAAQKVKELEAKIKETDSVKLVATNLKEKLEAAKKEADEAVKAAQKAKKEFDEKKYNLDLARERANKAHDDVIKEKERTKQAEIRANVEENKGRNRKIIAGILAFVTIIGLGVAIAFRISDNQKEAEQIATEQAQLEEDYENGRVCIPVERVADFENNDNVCVDFYANYINDSSYYIFIDNAKNGTFALMINKSIISEDEAKEQYLNKHLEARGRIVKYENTYEIKIYDLSQITIK